MRIVFGDFGTATEIETGLAHARDVIWGVAGTVRAIGPSTESGFQPRGRLSLGTSPGVGRKPTMPLNAAGLRSEPPMSLPSASATMPVASAAAAPPELSEAARALGSDGFDTFRRVVAPLVLPSALTGAALVFIAASTELTATLLLAPTGTETLATGFWEATSEIDYVAAAPYAALMIVLSAPVTLLMLRQSGASR